jgi:hypothetical protein
MPAKIQVIDTQETTPSLHLDPAPAPAPSSASENSSGTAFTMVPAHSIAHLDVSVQITEPSNNLPIKGYLDGRTLMISSFVCSYITLLSIVIGKCKGETNEACIGNYCFQACSSWWLVIIGATGLFRTLVLTLLISMTKCLYGGNISHSSCLFFSNHLIRSFEKVLFYCEVVLVVFIGFSIEKHSDEFIDWFWMLLFILGQIFVRFICFIWDLVRHNRDIVKRNREPIHTSNV